MAFCKKFTVVLESIAMVQCVRNTRSPKQHLTKISPKVINFVMLLSAGDSASRRKRGFRMDSPAAGVTGVGMMPPFIKTLWPLVLYSIVVLLWILRIYMKDCTIKNENDLTFYTELLRLSSQQNCSLKVRSHRMRCAALRATAPYVVLRVVSTCQ